MKIKKEHTDGNTEEPFPLQIRSPPFLEIFKCQQRATLPAELTFAVAGVRMKGK